jgi:hypothetical protein
MTLFIQGLAIPLGTKNLNGWGIPEVEADNVLNSLKASSLKVCPGEAHLCDLTQDPYGRIGHIVDAWKEADGIHAKGHVTDSVAARKIREGTWKDFKWSTFADSKIDPKSNDGWAGGVTVKSMTLVKNPAWTQAQYQIIASEDSGPTEIRLFSDFTIFASGDENIPTDDELKAAQTKIADMQKEIDTMKQAATVSASTIEDQKAKITSLSASIVEKDKALNIAVNDVTEAKTALADATGKVDTLTASVSDLETKLGEKTTLVASLEMKLAGSIPMEQFDDKLAAAMEKHDAEKEAKTILTASREKFVAARKELGMETKNEEFTTLSAADFDTMTEMLSVKLTAGRPGSGTPQIKYPADPVAVDYGFATGAYNEKTKEWTK